MAPGGRSTDLVGKGGSRIAPSPGSGIWSRVREVRLFGDRPMISRRNLFRVLSAAGVSGVVALSVLCLPGVPDSSNPWVRGLSKELGARVGQLRRLAGGSPERRSPSTQVSPVWHEYAWLSELRDPNGLISRDRTFTLVKDRFGEAAAPEALHELIRVSSPTLYLNADAMAMDLGFDGSDGLGLFREFHSALVRQDAAYLPSVPFLKGVNSPEKQLHAAWGGYRSDFPKGLPSPPPGLTAKDAHKELEDAMVFSGLAGIRVPLPYLSDRRSIWDLAQTIRQAELDLRTKTGLGGPLLGLNYRVILSIGVPGTSLTEVRENGLITVKSNLESLSHEWFHVLDFVLPGEAFKSHYGARAMSEDWSDRGRPLSPHGEGLVRGWGDLWHGLSDPKLSVDALREVDAQARALIRDIRPSEYPTGLMPGLSRVNLDIRASSEGDTTAMTGSPFMIWRRRAADYQSEYVRKMGAPDPGVASTSREGYLRLPREILSTHFNSQCLADPRLKVLGPAVSSRGVHLPSYRVMPAEIQATSGVWDRFFDEVKPWWDMDRQRSRSTPGYALSNMESAMARVRMSDPPGKPVANPDGSKPKTKRLKLSR